MDRIPSSVRKPNPGWLPALVGFAVVIASLAVDRVVQFDPQGWLLWGREITSPALHFSTQTYPSWKPLPFLVALPLSLTGGAAPTLWLAIERSAALGGLALAWSLSGGGLAGLFAAGGVALAPHWMTLAIDGRSEPLVIALLLGGVAAHRSGRRGLALTLFVLAALDRPEAFPIACVYAALYLRRRRRELAFAIGLLALVPAMWLGGDWLGSGSPLHGAELAHAAGDAGRAPGSPFVFLVRTWLDEVRLPLLLGAVAATALAIRRGRRLELGVGLLAIAWLVGDAALLARGYPESQIPRFLLPGVAVACVLGGRGIHHILHGFRPGRQRLATGLATLAVVAPFAVQGADAAAAGVRSAAWYAHSINSLSDAIQDAGGGRALLGCGHLAVDGWADTQLAWELDVMPNRLGMPRSPGLVLAMAGARYEALQRLETEHAHLHRLARVDDWNLLYAGRPTRGCPLARAALAHGSTAVSGRQSG